MKTKTFFSKIFFIILIISLIFNNVFIIYGCTIFTKYNEDVVLVGNNEDWLYDYPSTMKIVKGNDKTYGRVWFGNSSYIQGGMNEKGLFYDGAYCPETEVPFDENKKSLGMDLGDVVLSNCATVEEAVNFLKNYNIPSFFGDHILFVDSSGNSVVVEWLNNEMIVIKNSTNYQIATNFFLSDKTLGGYPCNRYEQAEDMLSSNEDVTPQLFTNILSKTKQDWGDGGTKYSNIYDLKQLQVYTYNKADFSKVTFIDLQQELNKLQPEESFYTDILNLNYQKVTESYWDSTPISEINMQAIEIVEKDNEKNISFIFLLVLLFIIILFSVYKKTKKIFNKN